MSSEQPSRRPAAKAGGGAPMGSTVSIIIAVVAVVVGFLVLRNINDSDSDTTSAESGTPNTDITGNSGDIVGTETTAPVPVETGPPTTAPFDTDPNQIVIVANASGIGGAAGQYTKALQGANFTTGKATDATTPKLELSVVYFLPGGESVAASVARAMGAPDSGVLTAAIPDPPPITGGTMPAGATVLVMLGTDRANQALPILAGTTATTALPVAPIDSTTSVAP